jgi:Domain of unknown function DUF29
MTQELTDLRTSILEGRYEDALAIVDELEGMSRQAILRNIESFLVRLMVHLIKNQIEQRLTNSWAASISDFIRQIKKLNLKDNKTYYYINVDEWQPFLEEAIEAAINPASVEVVHGRFKPIQISQMLDKLQLAIIAQQLLNLTYEHSAKDLPAIVNSNLAYLPGGEDWLSSGDS